MEAISFKGPDRLSFLTIVVKGTFAIPEQGQALSTDAQAPIAYGDEPFDKENGGSIKFESDIAPFKPRADIVLVGNAYAPPSKLVTGIDVCVRIGSFQKVLRVLGDRTWQSSTFSAARSTSPVPFEKMPIIYERAYGGIDTVGGGYCSRNLVGCGYVAKPTKKNVVGKRLPNIEDPRNPIQSPKDHPDPMGYGFYGRTWEPRCGFLGTFDDHYRKTIAPDPPPDFKFDYYNGAHPDMQLPGYLKGDESIELINLSEKGILKFQLPGRHLSCVVNKTYEKLKAYLETIDQGSADRTRLSSNRAVDEEVPLNLDTLCLIPDEKRLFLLWRGRTPVYDHTALEVETVTIS